MCIRATSIVGRSCVLCMSHHRCAAMTHRLCCLPQTMCPPAHGVYHTCMFVNSNLRPIVRWYMYTVLGYASTSIRYPTNTAPLYPCASILLVLHLDSGSKM